MNIDAYNLDFLRTLVRKLEKENQNLKQKLNEANIPCSSENIFDNSSIENAERNSSSCNAPGLQKYPLYSSKQRILCRWKSGNRNDQYDKTVCND